MRFISLLIEIRLWWRELVNVHVRLVYRPGTASRRVALHWRRVTALRRSS